jgi:hypothetical protein
MINIDKTEYISILLLRQKNYLYALLLIYPAALISSGIKVNSPQMTYGPRNGSAFGTFCHHAYLSA